MMSGPHFEQLRTRLKGLGLGRVGMKKLKNSHKGRVVRKFRTPQGGVRNFRTGENGVRNFRIPVILQDREHGFENFSLITMESRIKTLKNLKIKQKATKLPK